MSFFSVKHHVAVDPQILEQMRTRASEALRRLENTRNGQVIVFCTVGGRELCMTLLDALASESADEAAFWERFVTSDDNAIRYLLCTWQSGEIDLPSHRVRTRLCEINAANRDAAIIVPTENGTSALRLGVTLA